MAELTNNSIVNGVIAYRSRIFVVDLTYRSGDDVIT